MKPIISKNSVLKTSIVSLIGFFSLTANAADGDAVSSESWGSPIATFSNVSLGSGTEGIDISASFGGYLGGLYQYQLELASKQDLEHYEVNYLLLNTASESGITINTTWSEDVEFDNENGPGDIEFEDINTADLGLFSKLSFPDARIHAYPRMSVGYMWGEDILETTYVEFEVAVLFNINEMFWIEATPTYLHSMEGVEIDEFTGELEAGAKLSETFGVSVSINDDEEFLGRVIFAF